MVGWQYTVVRVLFPKYTKMRDEIVVLYFSNAIWTVYVLDTISHPATVEMLDGQNDGCGHLTIRSCNRSPHSSAWQIYMHSRPGEGSSDALWPMTSPKSSDSAPDQEQWPSVSQHKPDMEHHRH